jgi:hypothetical protein
MKARWAWAAALCGVLVLAGCIDESTKITVKTDGSGTIEKTIVLSKHLVELMQSMGGAKGDTATIEQSMLNENGLKAMASQMGTGVSFVSDQKVTTTKGNGYKALYSFTDISKVKISQNPMADITLPSGPSSGAAASATAQMVTFTFVKGSPAALTIVAPKPEKPSAKPAAPPASGADADKMMATVKPLYADMHIGLIVEVQGKITDTNALYANGSTVTLVEMDFAKIVADEATFKKLMAAQGQSTAELANTVKAVPGIKLDTQESVTVRFK